MGELIGGEKVKLFSITDVGKRREINEDYIYTSDKMVGNLPNLFIVCVAKAQEKSYLCS